MNDLKVTDNRMKEEPETAVAVQEPNAVLLTAMQKGYAPEVIEKMMALQERHDATEARKAFHRAMSAFKADPPEVWRDLQVKFKDKAGKDNEWSHADLGKAADAINVSLGNHGLNSTWRLEPQESGVIKVSCVLTHELGHSESTWLMSPPDTSGSKNSIQAIGSTIFYLERYTLFAITGLAPARMDNDGGPPKEIEYLSTDMVTEIKDKIDELKIDIPKFLGYMSKHFKCDISSVDKIPASGYKLAMNSIKAKEEKK